MAKPETKFAPYIGYSHLDKTLTGPNTAQEANPKPIWW
jgi:hypothetical protein